MSTMQQGHVSASAPHTPGMSTVTVATRASFPTRLLGWLLLTLSSSYTAPCRRACLQEHSAQEVGTVSLAHACPPCRALLGIATSQTLRNMVAGDAGRAWLVPRSLLLQMRGLIGTQC